MPKLRGLVPLLLLPLASGCASGFYLMQPVKLEAPPAPGQSAPGPTLRNSVPYLTITAFGHPENLFNATPDYNHDLQILKLDADFAIPGATDPLSVVVLAYDLKNNSVHASAGQEILKSFPVMAASGNAFNLTLKSSAIESNLADKFLAGLDIVNGAAGHLLSSVLGSQATTALGAASKVLGQFQSPQSGTTSSSVVTINPTSALSGTSHISGEAQALILVPTGGSLRASDKVSGSAPSAGIQSEGASPQYKARVEKLRTLHFTLCSSDRSMLCTLGEGNAETPYGELAYVLLVPSLSYRITSPDFLWPNLPVGGNCQFDQSDFDRYENAVALQHLRLTPSQYGLENEIIESARNLLSLRSAVANATGDNPKPAEIAKIFASLDKELNRRTPTDPLYGLVDNAGRSYQSVQTDLRQCMVSNAETFRGGVFRSYATAITELIDADQQTDSASRINQYNSALSRLDGLQISLKSLGLDIPDVVSQLGYDILRVEAQLFDLSFRKPIEALYGSDKAKKDAAKADLAGLIATSGCDTCKTKARTALTETGGTPPAAVATLLQEGAAASSNLVATKGSLQVATSVLSAKNKALDPTDAKAISDQLEGAKVLLSTGVDEKKIAKVRQAADMVSKIRESTQRLIK